jgi:hypothetical protein
LRRGRKSPTFETDQGDIFPKPRLLETHLVLRNPHYFKSPHASVRHVLRQAWELDDADKAEKLIRNLAQRLERDWSGGLRLDLGRH